MIEPPISQEDKEFKKSWERMRDAALHLADLIEQLLEDYDALQEQRDDLLAACNEAMALTVLSDLSKEYVKSVQELLRSAIAKAEGKE